MEAHTLRVRLARLAGTGPLAFGAALLLMAGGGCGRRTELITVAGATAFLPAAERLAEAFMQAHPGVQVTVQPGGSRGGIQAARTGAAQVGVSDLPRLPESVRGELSERRVAYDVIAVVVHPANPVTNLSRETVCGLFDGTLLSWPGHDTGQPAAHVTVAAREAASGTRVAFEEALAVPRLAPGAVIQESSLALRAVVARDRLAVGYLSLALVDDSVRALRLDDVECSLAAAREGRYPLRHPVSFVTRPEVSPGVRAFVEFACSPEGQRLLAESGFLPAVAVDAAP